MYPRHLKGPPLVFGVDGHVFPRKHQDRKERGLDRDGKFGFVQLNAVKTGILKKQRQCARRRIGRKRNRFGDDEPRENSSIV
jgi:hypothetical protein